MHVYHIYTAFAMKLQILTILMLQFCLALQDYEVYYIAPESPSVCPVHSCPTLSDFVMSTKINSSIIVVFLPGDHTLNSTVYITNITRFSMISNAKLQKPVITCQYNTSFVFDKVGQVAIQQLMFVGCGNNRVMFCPHFLVANSTFFGQSGSGTALEMINTTASVFSSSFEFNTIGSYRGPVGIVRYWNLTENTFAYIGGALIANYSNLTLVACYFEGNVAHIGGAIYSTMGSNITIANCMFVRNFAIQHFNLNFPSFGGAVHCENGKSSKQSIVVLLNGLFHNNSASRGGAICAINNVLIKIISTNFSANSASLEGGVLAMYNSTSLIYRSLFVNNQATIRGGAFILFRSIFNLSTSYFQYNRGFLAAGVMSLGSYCSVLVYQCKFFRNAAQYGGVIGMALNNVTVMHSEFDNNSALSQGAVMDGSFQPILYISNCSFTNNVANIYGGGVISLEQCKSLTISGSRFTRNRSIHNPGGVLSIINVVATLYNCLFLENHAQEGGVLIAYQSSVTFDHISNLTNNTATIMGGAISAIDSKLIVNQLLVLMHNKANFFGGGAYLHHSELVCQIGSLMVVSNNKAQFYGGGMHMSNTYVTVLFSRYFPTKGTAIYFVGNVAERGGAVYLEDSSAIHVIKSGEYITGRMEQTNNLYFTKNFAIYGAAIFVFDRTYYGVCPGSNYNYYRSECFFQVLSPSMTSNGIYHLETIRFEKNNASSVGSILFGGQLDRCTLRSNAEILHYNKQSGRPVHKTDGFTYF